MNPNNSNNNPFYTPLDDDEVNPFQTMNSNPFYQNNHNNQQQQSNQRNAVNDAFGGNEGMSNDLMPQRVKEENQNQNQSQNNTSGFETNFNDGLTVNNNDNVYSEALRNLKEICPTIDTEVLELILQNNDNNLEKSINEALTLSDPSYVPPTTVSRQDNTQQISDEQLARSIQEEENRVNKFHQTQNDEAYARAILAAEQQYINDIRQQREGLRQRSERTDRNERGELESDNNISKILESTKKKFMGLFKSKSEEDNYHRPLNDDQSVHSELSHSNPNTTSILRNNNNQQYNLQNEVTLEKRNNPNINNRYNNNSNNNDLLNDDISEDMTPIKPISHLNNEGNYYNQNNNFNINDPIRSVSPSTNKNKNLNTNSNSNQDLFESNVVFEENHNNNNHNNNHNITTSNSNIVSQDQVEFDSNPFLNSDDLKNRKKSTFH